MSRPKKVTDLDKPWNQHRKLSRRKLFLRPEYKRFLIVSEGSKTEPNYFRSIQKRLRPGTLVLEIQGLGTNTLDLVERAEKARCQYLERGIDFDQIWVLFDKDSFPEDDFDNAIHALQAVQKNKLGYRCAWSNEAFELWYLLHFAGNRIPDRRSLYGAELRRLLETDYEKNLEGDFEMLERKGDHLLALKRARELDEKRKLTGDAPSKANPCTTVYLLMNELSEYLGVS